MKKHDLPAMPFYWGDWFKCPEVRALSPAARCLWFEMLGLMWESTERGYLSLNGHPMDRQTLSRCLGFACDLLDGLLGELERYGVYSVREDGCIYNRRMVRDAEISKKRAIAGHTGGVCSSKTRSKTEANTQANTEDENEKHLGASTAKYSSAAIAAFLQEFVVTIQGVDPKFRITQQDRVQAHTVLDELLNRDGYTIEDIKQTASEAKRRDMHYKSISTLAKYLRNGTFRA